MTPNPPSSPCSRPLTVAAAYFEHSPDVAVACLDRAVFESRLKADQGRGQLLKKQDPAWFATCNTVYASGSRILLSKSDYSSTFTDAQTAAWQYFQNALEVLPELLSASSNLDAIRAVVLMVIPLLLSGQGAALY